MPLPTFRVDTDLAPRLPRKSVDHGKPKASALAQRLRGEKWVENARDEFGRHAGSGVGTRRETYCPGASSRSLAARSSNHLFAVSMVSLPPSGIASRAFIHKLSSAFFKLILIDQCRPKRGRATLRCEWRVRLSRPNQYPHIGDQPVHVRRLGSRRWRQRRQEAVRREPQLA